ncbi:MAG TPA: hypothetical protein VGK99_19905 [Acidobacteriota bacterium]
MIVLACAAFAAELWALGDKEPKPQFQTREGFTVEEVFPPEKSGSVVNMTFDSQGRLAYSQEKGPVFILVDSNQDGRPDRAEIFTDKVTNCQGLCFDGPDLYAVGEGPDGTGLYRVTDSNGDGKGDYTVTLARFTRQMAEHGPHAVLFGPDGMLYVVMGNHTGLVATPDPLSPYKDFTEGQLLPIYTDPRGHAANVRAPGGVIIRGSVQGQRWELITGGYRNQYDAGFNLMGELFTFDSDMEWDINLPWYRPVRTVHVIPGGEYGWRTGSGPWPPYFPDSLPPMTELGRGSPVGVAFYQDDVYPREFRDSWFLGDWSRGRILVGFLKKSGATYSEKLEDFVLGEPLNVTDLAVGPDGFVYFSKGGRFTESGIFRVVYGSKPANPGRASLPPLQQALSQPQPRSSFGRAQLRALQNRLGPAWKKGLVDEVKNAHSEPEKRVRALELLQVHGPAPDEELLISLGKDAQWEMRAASTYYLGLHSTDSARRELVQRFRDTDPLVARRACEALVRTGIHPAITVPLSPVRDVFPLLSHSDRWVRYSARQLLRRTNRNLWRDEAFRLSSYPAATEALLALAQTAGGTNDVPYLLDRELELLKRNPDDANLLGLLRVVHLTMIQDDGMDISKVYEPMGKLLLARFPGQNAALNIEIARTLARLETPDARKKILQALGDPKTDNPQQILYAYFLRAMRAGWDKDQKEAFLRWFEKTQDEHWKGGASFLGYIENIWNDFLKVMPDNEREIAQQRIPSLSPEKAAAGEKIKPAFRRATENQTVSVKELEEFLLWDPMSYSGNIQKGKESFEKAFCSKCHLLGDIGLSAGPDLTDIGKRFQRKDMVDALLYPSKTISDQWAAVEITMKDDQTALGVITRDDANAVTLLTATGALQVIPKAEIKGRAVSKTSLMPEGLMENLTQQEMINLFAFLEQRTKPRIDPTAKPQKK